MLGIKPGAAGWEARMLPLCYAAFKLVATSLWWPFCLSRACSQLSNFFFSMEMRLPGMVRPLKPIPVFKQEPGETQRRFFNRMETTVQVKRTFLFISWISYFVVNFPSLGNGTHPPIVEVRSLFFKLCSSILMMMLMLNRSSKSGITLTLGSIDILINASSTRSNQRVCRTSTLLVQYF